MLDMWPLEAYPCFSNTNNFFKVEKRPLKGRHPCKIRVLFLQKSETLDEFFNINLLKGEILGLLTPIFVVYPLICGQVTLVTFCINKRS
jgi:hypothetical protein